MSIESFLSFPTFNKYILVVKKEENLTELQGPSLWLQLCESFSACKETLESQPL